MIRVAFLINFSKEYKGGINYIKNLLYTNSVTKFPDLEFYVIVPSNIEQEYVDMFSPYAKVVYTDIFKSYTIPWFLNKAFNRTFKYQLPLYLLFKKHKINIVSHSFFWGKYKSLKLINWIPDFQRLHFPELWTQKQLNNITNIDQNIVNYSDIVILSSYDALNDYKKFAPSKIDKARVLQFVSQPGEITGIDELYLEIKKKYNLSDGFFYLPNQFWSHKNHIVVLKAINLLVKEGLNPVVVTTGVMHDFRGNNRNIELIKEFIAENSLEKNVLLLGLIPYNEVLVLMRKCKAVINPSFFEGWSSTVEEAKSIGKTVVISDIPVHREQKPPKAFYFPPTDENLLSGILKNILNDKTLDSTDVPPQLKEALKSDLLKRTIAFSENYYKIVKDLIDKN
ncbi:glycosyltransferase family 4 protein [Mucilaginibacter rubeus]|uniref:Glycosyltransferase n=1 Tax=Mucilaginibacter rubeus TaxID=2027860 RepID=A0AAE6JDB1_9SPHI|nr:MULTISPECIES: glycosyltransferase [Mucilaginibacter]QEM03446.1 glycosyltransferase family 4 protein [Mucilaginibacter rubeus]QEM16061.1 glycosyltransferase family 4 protein [Mucilaginibacter gossypii]QTE41184.1 glycosyltransferase [Mucilaginibacter rubeus]QTE47788.1 glycosyltransferase [Mucilaginibacter rubeus]QTE59179.1 glycosyltransferase [Mucilaginibacter rubeus]